MDGVGPQAAVDRGIEAVLRHDRIVVASSLALIVVLAWTYLYGDAASVASMHAGGAPMSGSRGSPLARFGMTLAMWAVMMVGMMLPSAAASILLYATLVRKHGERGSVLPRAWIYTSGYLAAWTVFSLAATLLQTELERRALLTPGLVLGDRWVAAVVLVGAGVYQLLPLKEACLARCRQPFAAFVVRWRTGSAGAFAMGVEHGIYCVGCCWILMLLLFVAGVMNLLWIALIAGLVLAEKLFFVGSVFSRVVGIVLIVKGSLMVIGG